jgi:hypothetical protein
MGKKLLALVVGDIFYAGDLVTPVIRLDSPEWFAWLDHPEHLAFAYHAQDVAITVRRTNGLWGAWRRTGEQRRVKKVYLGKSVNLTASRLATAACHLADPTEPDPRKVLRTAEGRSAWALQLDELATRLEQRGQLGQKDGRMILRLARQALAALDAVTTDAEDTDAVVFSNGMSEASE